MWSTRGEGEAAARRPRIDAELRAGLAVIGGVFPPTITPDLIGFMRQSYASPPIEDMLRGRAIDLAVHELPGHGGDTIEVSVLSPRHASGPRPGVVVAHSGGFMFGDRFSGLDLAIDWVDQLGLVLVTVEYRLAPEHPDPVPFEDCYAALEWTAARAESIGVRRDRLVVAGASAGAGIAAGLALAARDREGPGLAGQLLDYPMLDDRGLTESTRLFDGIGVWDRVSNETGWAALLGDRCGTDGVSAYAAPARATDLRGLPPAFLDVGTVEIFRDETVEYAGRLWSAGIDTELHVWPGGFHAFDIFAKHAALSRGMIATRKAWLERIVSD
ncbi:alpha/beta hydrolase [Knoellia subterranea]|uniref:Lipase n=1 Tax=Knoellia subterranea KCTC 19937 TaxID=1385521 RepID=A0A0A0JKL1_9MICO|nr:alpha/beta hydrolase fold domain-containing protein [Knoellia subterranea]KGN37965.1 lipase [Knoellia subterranea KCTC 19937]